MARERCWVDVWFCACHVKHCPRLCFLWARHQAVDYLKWSLGIARHLWCHGTTWMFDSDEVEYIDEHPRAFTALAAQPAANKMKGRKRSCRLLQHPNESFRRRRSHYLQSDTHLTKRSLGWRGSKLWNIICWVLLCWVAHETVITLIMESSVFSVWNATQITWRDRWKKVWRRAGSLPFSASCLTRIALLFFLISVSHTHTHSHTHHTHTHSHTHSRSSGGPL